MTVLLRFAPSPTGPLHLGGLRTALINHLYSRSHGGKWILRIEDTDATRYDANSLDDIRKSLEWAGLDYDFGPNRDGPHRPYFQSQRRDLYLNYAHKLLDSGHAYRCFCSPDRLVTTRAELSKRGLPSTYDRHCTKLTEEEVARRVRNGEKSIIRLNLEKVPVRKSIKDLVFGDFTDGHGSLPTDPVIIKSDLNPTYHLASVVDDHEMRISHVFRGEEWLTSLPLHLDLYAALNLNPPQFAHLPLLLNNDGSKMSKRHGDARVSEYIAKNFERDALLSWLAYAGWGTAGAEKENEISFYEPLPVESLIKKFDSWHPINRRTILDQKRLSALNRRDIQRQSKMKAGMKELKLRVEEVMSKHFTYIVNHHEQDYEHLIELAAGRVNNIEEFPSLFRFLYEEPSFKTPEGDANKRLYRQTILTLLALLNSKRPETREDYEAVLKELLEMSWAEQKTTFPIIRYVLTGHKNGVGVLDILCLTGFDKLVARLGSAADAIDSVSPDAPKSLATSDI